MTPARIRLAAVRQLEGKLAEILNPSISTLRAKKTKELGGLPDANIPKVVAFPTTG